MRLFLDEQTFLQENEGKKGKIAVLLNGLPVQMTGKNSVIKLVHRAKPEFTSMNIESCTRQFEYTETGKRFTGQMICTFSGVLEATEENSAKTDVTYVIRKNSMVADDKKDDKWYPDFSMTKKDLVRESRVLIISKDFDSFREDYDLKFQRVDADGYTKPVKGGKAGPRPAKLCVRCKNVGIENQRHPLDLCPQKCASCGEKCRNQGHCRQVLKRKKSEVKIEDWRKRRENENLVMGLIKILKNGFFDKFSVFFSNFFHNQSSARERALSCLPLQPGALHRDQHKSINQNFSVNHFQLIPVLKILKNQAKSLTNKLLRVCPRPENEIEKQLKIFYQKIKKSQLKLNRTCNMVKSFWVLVPNNYRFLIFNSCVTYTFVRLDELWYDCMLFSVFSYLFLDFSGFFEKFCPKIAHFDLFFGFFSTFFGIFSTFFGVFSGFFSAFFDLFSAFFDLFSVFSGFFEKFCHKIAFFDLFSVFSGFFEKFCLKIAFFDLFSVFSGFFEDISHEMRFLLNKKLYIVFDRG